MTAGMPVPLADGSVRARQRRQFALTSSRNVFLIAVPAAAGTAFVDVERGPYGLVGDAHVGVAGRDPVRLYADAPPGEVDDQTPDLLLTMDQRVV